jgi:hypothetical protein
MKEVINCLKCGKPMCKGSEDKEGRVWFFANEGPNLIKENNTEYIKCPHSDCGALHTILESDNPTGGSTIQIIGLKQ